MQFAALLAAIDRIRPGQRVLLFARTDAASTIADVQSSSPLTPSSSSTARCSLRHSPASVHAVNRRCAVADEKPNESGRYRHAHPLVSTYTTAVNTARSSTGAVPPPCGREANPVTNGAASSHSSSGTSRRDRSTLTAQRHAAPSKHHVRHPLTGRTDAAISGTTLPRADCWLSGLRDSWSARYVLAIAPPRHETARGHGTVLPRPARRHPHRCTPACAGTTTDRPQTEAEEPSEGP